MGTNNDAYRKLKKKMPRLTYYTIRADQDKDLLPLAILSLRKENGNAIRLLTLRKPSSYTGETLSLEMHRSSTSEYIALSYEWGPEEPDDPIILINNRPVQVRRNLHEAIRQISEHYSRYLRHRGKFECPHRRGAMVVDECAPEDRGVPVPSFPGDRRRGPVVHAWKRIKRGWKKALTHSQKSTHHPRVCGDRPEKDCYEETSCPWTNLENDCFWAKHDPPRLWIDALCINQNDISEKSFQVGMMGAIFSSAKLVFAWIGLPKDGSDEALRILSMQYEQLSQFVETGGLTDSLIATIVSFCERTYWHRVWILQELFLAQNYVVMCGPGSIVAESLDQAMANFNRLPSGPPQSIIRSAAQELVLAKRIPNLCTLKRWLRFCLEVNLQATVPHDYLYALLSISSDDDDETVLDQTKIEVDYGKPVAEVYRQLLQSFVEHPTSRKNRGWLLELSRKMGLSDQEGDALLDSEKKRRHDNRGELFLGVSSEPQEDSRVIPNRGPKVSTSPTRKPRYAKESGTHPEPPSTSEPSVPGRRPILALP